MSWPKVLLLMQLALTGGSLGMSAMLAAGGANLPESNIARHLRELPSLALLSAVAIAPVIESLMIAGALAFARRVLPRIAAVVLVGASFSLMHDMSTPAGYLIQFWPGLMFCAMNEIGIEKRLRLGWRICWLAAAHAVDNVCMLVLYFFFLRG